MSWITDLIGGGASKIVDSVVSGVDKFVTSDEDRQKLELLKSQAKFELEKLNFAAETERLKDVQSARSMYATDNMIQKILALLFTISFFGFMIFLLVWMQNVNLEQSQENLIYAMFGAVSGIMVTIIGFYFGSSQGSRDKDTAMSSDMAKMIQAAKKGD